jgi:hypothetical protein
VPEATMRLADVTYRGGKMEYRSRHATEPESALAAYLDEARRVFAAAVVGERQRPPHHPAMTRDFEQLRWFWLPREVAAELDGQDASAGAGI